MDPGQAIDGITHVTDTAATQGPVVYMAVLVVIILAALVVFIVWHTTRVSNRSGLALLEVVSNNTKALADVSHMVARTCGEMEQHEALTAVARQDVHDNRKTLDRIDGKCEDIDARTKSMDSKLDTLVKRSGA